MEARSFARLHYGAHPIDVIAGRNVKFAAALRVPTTVLVNERIADALVAEARRLNVPRRG